VCKLCVDVNINHYGVSVSNFVCDELSLVPTGYSSWYLDIGTLLIIIPILNRPRLTSTNEINGL